MWREVAAVACAGALGFLSDVQSKSWLRLAACIAGMVGVSVGLFAGVWRFLLCNLFIFQRSSSFFFIPSLGRMCDISLKHYHDISLFHMCFNFPLCKLTDCS